MYAGTALWRFVIKKDRSEGFIDGRVAVVVGIVIMMALSIGVQVGRWGFALGLVEIAQQLAAIAFVYGWARLVSLHYERIVPVRPGVRTVDERLRPRPASKRHGAARS
jgi:hypothetical protein